MTARELSKTASFLLAGMIFVICRPAEGRQGNTPPLSDAAMARFADDLTLSEAQRVVLLDLVAKYQAKFHEARSTYNEDRNEWTHQHYINAKPELDESFDISHLPFKEQQKIKSERRSFEGGGIPAGILNQQQLEEMNDHTIQLGVAFRKLDQQWRDETLAELRNLLAPEQHELWPMAMRRLDINIEDQNPTGRHSPDDPRRRVDMLAMLVSATEEDGGELHAFTDALLTPDRVLAFEKNNQDLIDLAGRVLAFEMSYRDALMMYERQVWESLHKMVTLSNRGDQESAASLERKELNARRRVWNVRLRFVEDIANISRELLGEEASRVWQRRCREQFCPVLFKEESTDMLFENILTLEDLDADLLVAMREIYERHVAWREEFKPRVMRLEIEERYEKVLNDPKDERGASERLEEAHQTRIDRAKQVNQQLRALLPPEHRAAFDAWWEAWQAEHSKYPYPHTIGVRP